MAGLVLAEPCSTFLLTSTGLLMEEPVKTRSAPTGYECAAVSCAGIAQARQNFPPQTFLMSFVNAASLHAWPRPGDVWLYATPILHASDAAVEPLHRRVLQVDYAADWLPGGLEWLGI